MSTNSNGGGFLLPRILVAGLRGSGGKTLVSVGLAAVLRKRGRAVVPFKKGADYIDAAWLAAAAGRPCRNLDLFMLSENTVVRSFVEGASGGELSVIEGNRGLFDGMDAEGTYSTAALGKLIKAPVILVCDCTKTTRTLAAMVLGCKQFDPDLEIGGVILNRVAGSRHERGLRDAIGRYCGLPVLGAVPRLREDPFPERHLGLVPPQETAKVPAAVKAAALAAEEHLDLEAIEEIGRKAPLLDAPTGSSPIARGRDGEEAGSRPPESDSTRRRVRIAVFRDEAFQFYYPENLEALKQEGAEIVEASPLKDESVPKADAIYIGGGFPEMFAAQLGENADFRRGVVEAVEAGTPVYAECAGAVYLGESLVMGENTYPMTGAFPVVYGFGKKPQWHGYAVMEVSCENPYYAVGETLRGHEFHYSRVLNVNDESLSFVFRVGRGYGVDGQRDGMCRVNALATYCHIHALGVRSWARSLVQAGLSHTKKRASNEARFDYL